MSRQDKKDQIRNHVRQCKYRADGIIMLPKLREEREAKKKGGKKNG